MARKSEIVILTKVEQLKTLAKLIRVQEGNSISSTKFESEPDKVKFLHDSKNNYDTITKLLDSGVGTKAKFEPDVELGPIANDIYMYVIYAMNGALQAVRNLSVRKNFLQKVEEHVISGLINDLDHLDPKKPSEEEIQKLTDEARASKEAMLEFVVKYRSKDSLEFTKWVKTQGYSFQQLVQLHQAKLKIPGSFRGLKDELKFKVYEDIVEASGRGKMITVENVDRFFKYGRNTVLVLIVFLTAWDIYSADHPEEVAIRDVVFITAKVGGAMLGNMIGAAIGASLFVGFPGAAFFFGMFVLACGFLGAFVCGQAAEALLDHFMGSAGGELPADINKSLVYVMPMPDGVVLARQLTHHA